MRVAKKTLVALLPVLLLAACAQAPKRAEPASAAAAETAPQAERGLAREQPSHLPNVELTQGLLYELLAAEMAAQQGASIIAYTKYMELAQRTHDPRLARRATRIALNDRDQDKILRASQLWAELDPDSVEARLNLAQSLLAAGRGEEAAPHLEKLLESGGVNVTEVFSNIMGLLARNPDHKSTLVIVQHLAAKYPALPEAHFAVARAAVSAGDDDLAIREARAAAKLKPGWDLPVRLAAQVLGKRSPAEASAELKAYLAAHPDDNDVRQDYARSLFVEKKTAEARAEFQRIDRASPGNPDVLFALGRLALEAHDYPSADTYLKKLLAADPRDSNLAYLSLGQVAEEQKKYAEARDWWKQIGQGEQYFGAQSLIAGTYAKEGKIEEGRAYLRAVPTSNNQQRVQMIIAEVQLLRDANRNAEAFEVAEKGLDKLPNHPDLLYESAMTAEKLSRMDVQETQLKKLIQIKPDYAQAYNALGYSWADRNERLVEAKDMIEKALKIAPDDAAIIDSMGWVLYRLGDLARAEELLRRAYEAQPDPEIAAHLGEVLWKANKHAEADRVWRGALAKAPNDETLKSTMKRLKP